MQIEGINKELILGPNPIIYYSSAFINDEIYESTSLEGMNVFY